MCGIFGIFGRKWHLRETPSPPALHPFLTAQRADCIARALHLSLTVAVRARALEYLKRVHRTGLQRVAKKVLSIAAGWFLLLLRATENFSRGAFDCCAP